MTRIDLIPKNGTVFFGINWFRERLIAQINGFRYTNKLKASIY
jgi:hypothetical protein